MAQVSGNTAYIPTVDVQGAHENGGRGCAGCHAPHSGGRGAGGGAIVSTAVTGAGTAEGDSGLWGTDTAAVTSAAGVFNFDGSYTTSLVGLSWSSGSLYTGVATCLSCHDGNISKGAMMSGQAYEQSFGLLNFATNVGSNGQAATVNLYGAAPIPTLLGNDGGVAGDYANDHPVGPLANLGKVASAALGNGLTYTVNGTKLTMSVTAGTTYANFVANYGTPAINSLASNNDGIAGNLYVVCTTCHNQHTQNVYASSSSKKIAGNAAGHFATIFYVNGPYNPGAPYDPTHVPSTNRFCLQCHFSHASEYFGATTVGTAF
jgi:cytochrome c553